MNIFTLCRKKIHFHVSTSLRANSSGYSDDLCKYYCNSLSVYSQCDGSQFAEVFFVTFALITIIIIHSSLSTATTYSKSLLFWKDAIPFCVVEIETAQTSQLKKNSAKPQYFHCITASGFSVNTLQWDLKQSITWVSNKVHFFQHFLQDQACLHFVRAKYGQSWVSIGKGMSKVGRNQ